MVWMGLPLAFLMFSWLFFPFFSGWKLLCETIFLVKNRHPFSYCLPAVGTCILLLSCTQSLEWRNIFPILTKTQMGISLLLNLKLEEILYILLFLGKPSHYQGNWQDYLIQTFSMDYLIQIFSMPKFHGSHSSFTQSWVKGRECFSVFGFFLFFSFLQSIAVTETKQNRDFLSPWALSSCSFPALVKFCPESQLWNGSSITFLDITFYYPISPSLEAQNPIFTFLFFLLTPCPGGTAEKAQS